MQRSLTLEPLVALKRLKLKRLLIEILNRLTPYLGEAHRQRHAVEDCAKSALSFSTALKR